MRKRDKGNVLNSVLLILRVFYLGVEIWVSEKWRYISNTHLLPIPITWQIILKAGRIKDLIYGC